ncbi:MAG: hypothetical protein M3132_03140 [Actinomycetia bacterium]|nr:hypothetical protein [Actinomycetes bacterium]
MALTSPNESPAFSLAPTKGARPPAIAIGVQAMLLVLALGGFFVDGLALDIVIALISVFGSVLAFGVARMLDDRRRTSAGYSDWSIVSARSLSLWLMLITWIIGLVHVWRAAIEFTRVYNL